MKNTSLCQLCGCKRDLTEHHLIPRTLHSTKWFKKNFTKTDMRTRKIFLCSYCHRFLHSQYTEKELGRNFNTLQKLLLVPAVQKFIKWAQKQKSTCY